MPTTTVETPSGKGSRDENFPVGSWLLPRRLRPHVATFYAFARAIDDIADNPDLSPQEKVARLDGFEAAVTGIATDDPAYMKAHQIRESLAVTGVPVRHCTDLIAAFKQDAVKLRYEDWSELLGYCALSANPVGRYLLDLHSESRTGYGASDALCSALQVINHLQDCQVDYRRLDRIYLPLDWMAAEDATVDELDGTEASPGLRRVLDRALDGVETLLTTAHTLPRNLNSSRLAMESAVIVRLAERLTGKLRRSDPIAGRVELKRGDFAACGVIGALHEIVQRLLPGTRSLSTARQS